MRKKILLGSIIAVVLLVLVSFSSVVGYSSVKSNPSNTIITDELDFEYCKDYLFETLVEISNNEDVKDLTNSNNQNLLPTNPNHRLLMPFRRNTNKVSLSVEHLDFLYNIGLKIIDRLGEEKVAEIMENVETYKPDYADELFTTIMGNGELRERIYTLNRMNSNEVSIADFEEYPVICSIIGVIAGVCLFVNLFTEYYFDIFSDNNNVILFFLLYLIYSPFMIVGIISVLSFFSLCWDFNPYPD